MPSHLHELKIPEFANPYAEQDEDLFVRRLPNARATKYRCLHPIMGNRWNLIQPSTAVKKFFL
ncbi:MAG: hypothetical protein R3C28_21445 [Pirellulaceae bacterium]